MPSSAVESVDFTSVIRDASDRKEWPVAAPRLAALLEALTSKEVAGACFEEWRKTFAQLLQPEHRTKDSSPFSVDGREYERAAGYQNGSFVTAFLAGAASDAQRDSMMVIGDSPAASRVALGAHEIDGLVFSAGVFTPWGTDTAIQKAVYRSRPVADPTPQTVTPFLKEVFERHPGSLQALHLAVMACRDRVRAA